MARTAPVGRSAALAQPGALLDLPYSPAVAEHFADPGIRYHTPGLQADRRAFTTNAEIAQWLQSLAGQPMPAKTRAEVLQLGPSQRGAAISALVLTQARDTQAQTLADSKRPTVLLVGQQHGNAPAAAEALLVVAHELAQGLLAPLLERINIIIVPRANPDGAETGAWATADGTDMARDHLLLQTPEARALAELVRNYRPAVVLDADEFAAAGPTLAQFGGLESHDAHMLHSTTGNVHEFVTKAAREWFAQPSMQALQKLGLREDWAHHPSAHQGERRMVMGNVHPDSLRNITGLRHAVGLSIASRGIGLGRTHIQRRVHTQVNAIASVLQATADRAARLEQVRSFAERETRSQACRDKLAVQVAPTPETRDITLLNPETGQEMVVRVDWDNALKLQATVQRARPCGYWLAADAASAVERLRLQGLQVLRVAEAGAILAEPSTHAEPAGANARLQRSTLDVPVGSYYLPMNQPHASVAAAALEADTPFGFAEQGLIARSADVVRVMASPSLVFEELD